MTVGNHAVDDPTHRSAVLGACGRIVVAEGAAVAVGGHGLVGGERRAGTAWPLVAVGRQAGDHPGVAVVSAVDDRDVVSSGNLPGDADGEIVGLAARTH